MPDTTTAEDQALGHLPIGAIVVGERARKEPDTPEELRQLADSIRQLGLLHPVVIDRANKLVAGSRRLQACRLLGWETVPVRVAKTLNDAALALRAEHDENVCRKPFTPTEAADLGRRLEAMLKPAAKERQQTGGRTAGRGRPKGAGKKGGGKLPQPKPTKTRDVIAQAVGMSGRTYEKAKAVVEAANQEPERFGDLKEQMNATGKVDPAYRELKRRLAAAGSLSAAPPAGPAPRPAPKAGAAVENESHAAVRTGDPDTDPAARVPRGVGTDLAHEAVNCLKRIPRNDALRKSGFQIVLDFVRCNEPTASPTSEAQKVATAAAASPLPAYVPEPTWMEKYHDAVQALDVSAMQQLLLQVVVARETVRRVEGRFTDQYGWNGPTKRKAPEDHARYKRTLQAAEIIDSDLRLVIEHLGLAAVAAGRTCEWSP